MDIPKYNEGFRSPSPSSFSMASSSSGKLAQEIHEEFLLCKICLEGYKSPKSLNCLHTFCEVCIENHVLSESSYKKYSDYREFTCPLCRKRTQLPIGGVKKLPDNFLVSSLSEIVGRQKPSKYPFCDICKMVSRKHREATSKCLDCAKLLCTQCVELHRETKVTSNHSIFDVEIEKDIECKEHEDEVVRFYCEPCETCICVLCTFNEHKDHEITQFGEAVLKYKEHIQELLGVCVSKIEKYDSQLKNLNKADEIIKEVEQKVHDTAIEYISEIRTKEKQMIEELRNMFGKETMEHIENKKELSSMIDGLKSTCNLTEVILKGKDIELLLLKKDVQRKLSSLKEVEVKELPLTITKKVNYITGDVDMGYLQDMDHPNASRMRMKKASKDEPDFVCPTYTDSMTQTDKRVTIKAPTDTSTSESESESETESDSEDEKPQLVESGVQTEAPESSSSSSESESETEDDSVETKEIGTVTDEILTEEKAVNTRSRSLQNRRSPPNDAAEDPSMAARRRRRRERAHTTYVGGSMDEPPYHDESSFPERRKFKSRFLHNHSLDNDDVYYDATPTSISNY